MTQEEKNFKEVSTDYLIAFGLGDIQRLKELYSDDIVLTDWNGQWNGKTRVLEMNNEIFKLKPVVHIHEIQQIGNRTYNHITIHINNESIKVIDVIEWSNDFKIIFISAYKG
jgi:ketosteroid isomerase-like protein